MKIRSLAVALAGLLLMVAPSFAQLTQLEGDVKGEDGKPLKGALIRIERVDVSATYKVTTDKKGHYLYTGLPLGKFNLVCVVDGNEVEKIPNVQTTTQQVTTVNFDLKEKADLQKAAATGTLSKEQQRGMSAEDKAKLEESYKKRAESMKKDAALNEAFNAGKTAVDAGMAAAQLAKTQTGADRDANFDKARTQYGQAIESLNKAGELGPKQGAVWSTLAVAHDQLGQTKTGADAEAEFQKSADSWAKAIELNPEMPGLHNNYALVLAECKKFPEAQAELEKAISISPADAGKFYYNLGALEINAGQNDAANETFKKAIAVTPPYPPAFYQYGITLVAKASYDKDGKIIAVPGTVEAFQKYLELAPTGPYAQDSKDMLTTLGSTLEVQYKNPDAKKKKTTK